MSFAPYKTYTAIYNFDIALQTEVLKEELEAMFKAKREGLLDVWFSGFLNCFHVIEGYAAGTKKDLTKNFKPLRNDVEDIYKEIEAFRVLLNEYNQYMVKHGTDNKKALFDKKTALINASDILQSSLFQMLAFVGIMGKARTKFDAKTAMDIEG